MPQIFEIPLSKLDTIYKRLRRVAKKNHASGLPTPSVELLETSFRETEVKDALARLRGADRNSRTVRIATAKIEVQGFTANAGDWDVIAYRWSHVVHTPAGDRVVTTSSEGTPDTIAARHGLECDHCKAERKRLSSYVVQKADGSGEMLEVGASCMGAFLGTPGHGVLSSLSDNAMLCQEISRMASEDFLLSHDDITDEIDTVLAVACSIIEREGFIPSKEAYDGHPATWIAVYEDVRRYRTPGLDDDDLTVTLSDFMKASAILEWVAGEDISRSSFMMRAARVLETGIGNPGDVAVLTALAATYYRHLADNARMEVASSVKHGSVHVGIRGDRSNFVCSVNSVRSFQGRFGSGDVVSMTDGSGNLLVWFASGQSHGLEVGRTYELDATVKKHETCDRGIYEGADQTVVTRVKVVQDLGETHLPQNVDAEHVEESREFDEMISMLAPSPR